MTSRFPVYWAKQDCTYAQRFDSLIVAVLGVFAVKSVLGPGKMSLVPTYDLHVAQPVDMKNFPSDVIPLP